MTAENVDPLQLVNEDRSHQCQSASKNELCDSMASYMEKNNDQTLLQVGISNIVQTE